jgi:hypothetical protein
MKKIKWGLDDTWKSLNLWAGSAANSLDAVCSAMVCISSIITLVSKGGQMTEGGIAETTLTILKSGFDVTKAGLTIKDIINAGGKYGNILSETTQLISAGSAFLDGTLAMQKTITATNQFLSQKNMKEYFDQKHKGEDVSEREKKFEKGITKLTDDVITRKTTAARCHYRIATAGVLSITLPGIGGTIAAVVGGVQALAASINDSKKIKSLRENMFDLYYNIDDLIKTIIGIKKNRSICPDIYVVPEGEALKYSVRQAVSDKAGHSDLRAAGNYIAGEYAVFIRGKLFGPKRVQGAEKEAYINAVEALDLKYDEEKGYPTEIELYKKMAGK